MSRDLLINCISLGEMYDRYVRSRVMHCYGEGVKFPVENVRYHFNYSLQALISLNVFIWYISLFVICTVKYITVNVGLLLHFVSTCLLACVAGHVPPRTSDLQNGLSWVAVTASLEDRALCIFGNLVSPAEWWSSSWTAPWWRWVGGQNVDGLGARLQKANVSEGILAQFTDCCR